MFLTTDDYLPVCQPRELDILQQEDTNIRERAELTAQEEIASYLRGRYDMAAAFAKSGSERNAYLVQLCVNVALYYLVQYLPGKISTSNRVTLYENALEWLKLAQSGKASPDLPAYSDNENNTTNPSFPHLSGSLKKQNYIW